MISTLSGEMMVRIEHRAAPEPAVLPATRAPAERTPPPPPRVPRTATSPARRRTADDLSGLGAGARAALLGATPATTATPGAHPGSASPVEPASDPTADAEDLARELLFHETHAAPKSGAPVAAAAFSPAEQPVLKRGSAHSSVPLLRNRLAELGYGAPGLGTVLDPSLRAALLEYQFAHRDLLSQSGTADRATWVQLAKAQPSRARAPTHSPGGLLLLEHYEPGAAETIALFEEAATAAGLPATWASSSALKKLLAAESNGWVGKPNYTYKDRAKDPDRWREVHAEVRAGIRTTRSTATGLGQLLLDNVDAHYPSGREGIGNAFEEAVGMLRYISSRYGTPEKAWKSYNSGGEGY